MQAPRVEGSQDRWSVPLYRIQEILDSSDPQPLADVVEPVSEARPWSANGYRVVVTSDRVAPTHESPKSTPRDRSSRASCRAARRLVLPAAFWVPVCVALAIGAVFSLLLAGYVLARLSAPRLLEPAAQRQRPIRAAGGNAREVVLPLEFAANAPAARPPEKGAEIDARPAGDHAIPPAENVCRPGKNAEADTFGTTVKFVRNADEAIRSAREQRKLAFLLHVSGNFEDAGFT